MSSGATSIKEKPIDSAGENRSEKGTGSDSNLEANLPAETGTETPEADPNASPRNIHGILVRAGHDSAAQIVLELG